MSEDLYYGAQVFYYMLLAGTPLLAPCVLTMCRASGIPIPWRGFAQASMLLLVVGGSYAQTQGAWAQQIENRVRTLEEWRDLRRDMLARQQDTNDRTAVALEKLTRITEDHEKRLNDGEKQQALIINTGETMVRVGGWAIILVPLLAAILNAVFNYWMFKVQTKKINGMNGGNGR